VRRVKYETDFGHSLPQDRYRLRPVRGRVRQTQLVGKESVRVH